MTVLVVATDQSDAVLTTDVIAHLDAQLASARRLLQIVLDQGAGDPQPRRPGRRHADRACFRPSCSAGR